MTMVPRSDSNMVLLCSIMVWAPSLMVLVARIVPTLSELVFTMVCESSSSSSCRQNITVNKDLSRQRDLSVLSKNTHMLSLMIKSTVTTATVSSVGSRDSDRPCTPAPLTAAKVEHLPSRECENIVQRRHSSSADLADEPLTVLCSSCVSLWSQQQCCGLQFLVNIYCFQF